MRSIIIFFIMICCQRLLAQEVVATDGSTLSSSSGSISYTIGEGVANTLTTGDKTLTQGFQQSNLSVSLVLELIDLQFNISVFPNPTHDLLTLSVSKEDVSGLQYTLIDTYGKILSSKKLESNETAITVKQFAEGLYILKVQAGKRDLKTFKIIKQ